MVDPALVSVIIPTYNSASTIERCLLSVQAQTYPHVEIIVVDRGSDDGTAEIAARYTQVLQAGPERSAQVNYGARQAKGTYLYRIDGDFELEPTVIQACVEAIERDDLDAVAVPNRSSGEGYWARVRTLERDTYLDDPLIVAARFWKRSAFEAVGGFDESLVACEDYDLHNRLLEQGYRLGRVEPGEVHLGEAERLWDYARQSFYYGPSVWRYLQKHPRRGARQMFPLRPAYVRHGSALLRQPLLLLGLVLLKIVQYTAAFWGMLAQALGLSDERGRRPETSIVVTLGFVLLALAGLGRSLSWLGVRHALLLWGGVYVGGLVLWQVVARRLSRRRRLSLPTALNRVALAFAPLLVLFAISPVDEQVIKPELRLHLLALGLGLGAAWLIYLAEIPLEWPRQRLGLLVLLGALVLGFIVLFSARSIALLRTFSLGAYDLALYDQALWRTVHGGTGSISLSDFLYSSIDGRSILAYNPAPILLLFLPVYALGLGSPAFLLIAQIAALGLGAVALYRLAALEGGRSPALLLAAAYLAYFLVPRMAAGSFQVMVWVTPLFLFALEAYTRRRYALYYVLLALVMACGLGAGIAVVALGIGLFFFYRDRQQGLITLGLGLLWTWMAVAVLAPLFGGTPTGVLAAYSPVLSSPDPTLGSVLATPALRYLGILLAPLGFLPLLGAPALLPALPQLLLNLLADNPRYTSLSGWYEFVLVPFLFVAIVRGVRWVEQAAKRRQQPSLRLATTAFVLVCCLVTSVRLAPHAIQDLQVLRPNEHQQIGLDMVELVPREAAVAAQSPLVVMLGHRRQLTVLPQADGANYIFFDTFHPNREPQPASYQDMVQRAFLNPEYGLRAAENGYLLFERGLASAGKLQQFVLAPAAKVEYARTVEITGTVAYLGFDLSTTQVRPGEIFYLTHYWKSLQPVDRPYLLFTAYPGSQRFESPAFGLYPVQEWQPGEIVRHEQALALPALPDGSDYEIAVGLWYDEGDPTLQRADQFLGDDVIRIATISVQGDHYEIVPWAAKTPGEGP